MGCTGVVRIKVKKTFKFCLILKIKKIVFYILESRVSSENSLRKGDVTKINRKPGFLSLFRKRDKREQYSRNSSLSSFAGTIYTVSSGSSLGGVDRQTDGKVPFDLLGDPKLSELFI